MDEISRPAREVSNPLVNEDSSKRVHSAGKQARKRQDSHAGPANAVFGKDRGGRVVSEPPTKKPFVFIILRGLRLEARRHGTLVAFRHPRK